MKKKVNLNKLGFHRKAFKEIISNLQKTFSESQISELIFKCPICQENLFDDQMKDHIAFHFEKVPLDLLYYLRDTFEKLAQRKPCKCKDYPDKCHGELTENGLSFLRCLNDLIISRHPCPLCNKKIIAGEYHAHFGKCSVRYWTKPNPKDPSAAATVSRNP